MQNADVLPAIDPVMTIHGRLMVAAGIVPTLLIRRYSAARQLEQLLAAG